MIKHPNRIKQVIDFSGFNNKIHPSDIDAVLEFDNKYLFLFEVKMQGIKTPIGQEFLLHRIADAWQTNENIVPKTRQSFVVYCEHNTNNEGVVNLMNTTVVGVYHNKSIENYNCNTYDLLKSIGKHYNINKLMVALNIK